ncbi:MAG: FecR family protein [Bacteroidota bacterium]
MKDYYADYSVADFLQDPYFYEWVRYPTKEHDAFWESWLINYPAKRETLEQARQVLLSIISQEEAPPSNYKAEDWKQIQSRIAETQYSPRTKSRPLYGYIARWAAAASVVLALGISAFLYLSKYKTTDWVVVQTTYGEQQSVMLPDQSVVTLNGNSTLRYASQWENQREVWLEGEAFFSVTKQPNKDANRLSTFNKFTVHANDLNVEVRGTQFNVQSRFESTRVVLSEGQVLVRSEQQDSILLRPNELAELTPANANIQKKVVNANDYTSWRNQVLTFDQEPIANILIQLEHTYGWQIEVQDSSWLQYRYTGSVPTNQIELLFEKFSLLYELDTEYRDQQVIIR